MKKNNGFGWADLAVGILLVLLGVFTFVRPDSVLTGAVVIYGITAIAMGIMTLLYMRGLHVSRASVRRSLLSRAS